ncbi:MAG: hypothetical protein FJZ43_04195 [Candidatus Staskawiczbacteria bacterium]|nr:hypothetical protein [Candidatus Staskawiczbacteria bacterium]
MPFFGKFHQRIKHFEKEFVRKIHEKFGPIGWKGEKWFLVLDKSHSLIDYHNFLLVFSSYELAYDFISSIQALSDTGCWIQEFTWESIENFCIKRNIFAGAIVDFMVREDFTFHSFKNNLA